MHRHQHDCDDPAGDRPQRRPVHPRVPAHRGHAGTGGPDQRDLRVPALRPTITVRGPRPPRSWDGTNTTGTRPAPGGPWCGPDRRRSPGPTVTGTPTTGTPPTPDIPAEQTPSITVGGGTALSGRRGGVVSRLRPGGLRTSTTGAGGSAERARPGSVKRGVAPQRTATTAYPAGDTASPATGRDPRSGDAPTRATHRPPPCPPCRGFETALARLLNHRNRRRWRASSTTGTDAAGAPPQPPDGVSASRPPVLATSTGDVRQRPGGRGPRGGATSGRGRVG